MTSTMPKSESIIIRILLREATVLTVILVNAIVVFLDAFPTIHDETRGILHAIDYGCIVYFIVEALLKIRRHGFALYWQSGWNRFDFIVVGASAPLLLGPFIHEDLIGFSIFPLLRLGRFVRFMRVMRFIPHAGEIGQGVVRALQASVGVFAVLFFLNVILALGATMLFGQLAPEYFGNPIIAIYTLFKVFTIEGWYEIPDVLAAQGATFWQVITLRGYFIVSVLVGGIMGLSLANAVFVDEMTMDNTVKLENMVADLSADLQSISAQLDALQRRLEAEGRATEADEERSGR